MKRSMVMFLVLALVLEVTGCATTHMSATQGKTRDTVELSPGRTINMGMTMDQVQAVAGKPFDTTSYRYQEFDIKNGKKTVTYVEDMPAWYYKTQNGEAQVLFKSGKVTRILVYQGK